MNRFLVVFFSMAIALSSTVKASASDRESCLELIHSNFPDISETAAKNICELIEIDMHGKEPHQGKKVTNFENRLNQILTKFEQKESLIAPNDGLKANDKGVPPSNRYSRNGYSGNGYQPNGYSGNGYQPNGYSGNGYQPNGYSGNGYQPNGYSGNGYQHNGFHGNGLSNQGLNSDQEAGTTPVIKPELTASTDQRSDRHNLMESTQFDEVLPKAIPGKVITGSAGIPSVK